MKGHFMKFKAALAGWTLVALTLVGIEIFASVQERSSPQGRPNAAGAGSVPSGSVQENGNGHFRRNGDRLPNIKFDKEPLSRDVLAGTSFAPIIKKVAPSVVTVYSTKTVRESSLKMPLDDPFLRRFFGTMMNFLPLGGHGNGNGTAIASARRKDWAPE